MDHYAAVQLARQIGLVGLDLLGCLAPGTVEVPLGFRGSRASLSPPFPGGEQPQLLVGFEVGHVIPRGV